jgi:hypothetical protein
MPGRDAEARPGCTAGTGATGAAGSGLRNAAAAPSRASSTRCAVHRVVRSRCRHPGTTASSGGGRSGATNGSSVINCAMNAASSSSVASYGSRPHNACCRIAPRAHTSVAGPTSRRTASGAMYVIGIGTASRLNAIDFAHGPLLSLASPHLGRDSSSTLPWVLRHIVSQVCDLIGISGHTIGLEVTATSCYT